jgi:uncharacterized protein HemX
MSFLIPFIPLIAAGIGAGTTIYGITEQQSMQNQQEQFQQNQQQQMFKEQQQSQQQAAEQALSTRQQEMRAEAPTLQSMVGGSLTPGGFQSALAQLTGNPGFGAVAPTSGSLTPAMENLFPSGGVPSLTQPYPTTA